MRHIATLILTFLAFFGIAPAASHKPKSPAKHTTPPKRVTSSKHTVAKTSDRNRTRVVRGRQSQTAKGRSSSHNKRAVVSRPAGQGLPTSSRYVEIQEALAAKGYLKSQPSGVWDQESVDAMKRFQADQKLATTGKLNSLSLIALGLGPKPAAAPEIAPH